MPSLPRHKWLSEREYNRILLYLRRQWSHVGTGNARQNLIVFRLLSGCGLRSCEAAGLQMRNLTGGAEPTLTVPREIAKGKKKTRVIELRWDRYVLRDLLAWRRYRIEVQHANGRSPLICRQVHGIGHPLVPTSAARRWNRFCIEVLGEERGGQVTSHSGRHSYATQAHRKGRTLAELRDALGHASLSTTNRYVGTVASEGLDDLWDVPAAHGPVLDRPPLAKTQRAFQKFCRKKGFAT